MMTKKTTLQIAEECGALIGGGIVVFPSNKQFAEFVEKIRKDIDRPDPGISEYQGDSTDYHGSGLPV